MKFNGIFLLYSMGSLSKWLLVWVLWHTYQNYSSFPHYLSNLSLFLAFFLLTSQTHIHLSKAEARLLLFRYMIISLFQSLSLHYYLLLPIFFVHVMDYRQVLLHCILTYFRFHSSTNCIFIFVVLCEIWSQKVEYDMVSFVKHSEYII